MRMSFNIAQSGLMTVHSNGSAATSDVSSRLEASDQPTRSAETPVRADNGVVAPLATSIKTHHSVPPTPVSPPYAPSDDERDPSAQLAEVFDRSLHFWISKWTLGLSPITIGQAYADWALHMAIAPGKHVQLLQKATRKSARLGRHLANQGLNRDDCKAPCIDPLPNDTRFLAPEWQSFPFNVYYQSFLLNQQWWHNAITGVSGVSAHHEAIAAFATRQILDVYSPSNFLWTNPTVLARTQSEMGQNLVRGWWNLVEDWERTANNRPPVGSEAFQAGRNLAMSPGKVIFRNRLIELIQYSPTTPQTHPEPILVVPAWIMKYYILDLTPEKSLVRHLVDQGFTVFMISWLNPDAKDRELTFDDYRRLGVLAALEIVGRVMPASKVHGVGYCLGGTLLATVAAAMARDSDERFATLSFLAAQVDFEDAGELTLFIDESQLSMLDDIMWEQGYLDPRQMAGAFQIIRSNDLIWSSAIRNYLMGERRPIFDLMAWNADSTRMPYRMHSEYLHRFFLDNDLSEGRYDVDGRPVTLGAIDIPVFAVATELDHVAPWKSVFKFHVLLDTDITFLLASGGHNAGIVPDLKRSTPHYRSATCFEHEPYVDPDTWQKSVPVNSGCWWGAWSNWLAAQSGPKSPAPSMGALGSGIVPLGDAPGSYVLKH